MHDLAFISFTVALFVLMFAYTYACESLR